MARKQRTFFTPPRKTKGQPAPAAPQITPPTVARINRQAGKGRDGIEIGMRVTILGTGLYAGETAVVESTSGGVIPAAVVRTESGRTRRVRTIDLAPAQGAPSQQTPQAEPEPEA